MILNEDLFDDIIAAEGIGAFQNHSNIIPEQGNFKDFEQHADLNAAQEPIPEVETDIVSEDEIKPDGPELGENTAIANIIHDLIIGVNETIQNYNNAAANMENYPELQQIMHNIAGEEFIHIGELEKALEIISPNAANIEEGEIESEQNLDPGSPIDEALNKKQLSQDQKDKINKVTKSWPKAKGTWAEKDPKANEYRKKFAKEIDDWKQREFGFKW